MPKKIKPMLATLSKKEPPEKGWIGEKKVDGMRCLVFCRDGGVKLLSRNNKKKNNTFPKLVEALKKISKKDFIADGEIVAFDGKVTSFSKLQPLIGLKTAKKKSIKVYLYLFDLLFYDGEDLRKEPLLDRKKKLKSFSFKDPVRFMTHHSSDLKKYHKKMCQKGEEGIIVKKKDGRYVSKRSKDWLKIKRQNQQEFVICGYTKPKGERVGIGALLIGYYKDGDLKYAGKVGTGYSDEMLKKLKKKLGRIKRKTCPVEDEAEIRNAQWVTPKLVAEVRFTEWTSDNKLRHPVFLGLREDKKAKNVRRE